MALTMGEPAARLSARPSTATSCRPAHGKDGSRRGRGFAPGRAKLRSKGMSTQFSEIKPIIKDSFKPEAKDGLKPEIKDNLKPENKEVI
jgi:hypothetical protein